jgi:hypothetical protein
LDPHHAAVWYLDSSVRCGEIALGRTNGAGVCTPVDKLNYDIISRSNHVDDLNTAIRKRRSPPVIISAVTTRANEFLAPGHIDKLTVVSDDGRPTFWIRVIPPLMEDTGNVNISLG